MKTATIIRDGLPGFRGEATLFRCDPPMDRLDYGDYSGDPVPMDQEYVIASSVYVLGEPETYIFPADAEGKITNWGELDGSRKGEFTTTEIMELSGYTVVPAEEAR